MISDRRTFIGNTIPAWACSVALIKTASEASSRSVPMNKRPELLFFDVNKTLPEYRSIQVVPSENQMFPANMSMPVVTDG